VTCDEVRSDLAAFIEGELPERLGTELVDHLESCPACALAYEELTELVGSLQHARVALRPLHSFELAPVPVARRRRTTRLLSAAAILVGVWAIFCSAALLWPSLGARMAFLRIGPEAGTVSPVSSHDSRRALSLSTLPPGALAKALRSLSSGTGLALGSPSNQGLLSSKPDSVRVTRLGPVLFESAKLVRLRAAVDVVETSSGGAEVRHLQVVMILSRQRDGGWVVTRVVADTP